MTSQNDYLKEWGELKETSEKFFTVSVCLIFAASIVVEPLNRTIHGALWFGGKAATGIGSLVGSGSDGEKMGLGGIVAGFPVTSPYGYRKHPVLGTQMMHRGVDIATPTGTPLYAPVETDQTVTVRCWTDTAGGGLVATVTDRSGEGSIELLHLADCTPGDAQGGAIIARSGATGIGTGPHLHIQEKDALGQTFEPRKSIAMKVVGGVE